MTELGFLERKKKERFLFLRITTLLLLQLDSPLLSTLFIRGGLNLVFHSWGWEALKMFSSMRNVLPNFSQTILFLLKSNSIGKGTCSLFLKIFWGFLCVKLVFSKEHKSVLTLDF